MKRRQQMEQVDHRDRTKRRVHQMSSVDLYDWADAAGNGLYKAFQDYRQHGHAESLEEIGYAVIALQSVVDELLERHKV